MSTRVREIRLRLLLTQHDLARKAGVSLRTVHAIEKGRPCRHSTKRKVLKALGLDVSNLHQVWPERP